MTANQKKELAVGGVLAAIVVLLLLFTHKAAAHAAAPAFPGFASAPPAASALAPVVVPVAAPVQPPATIGTPQVQTSPLPPGSGGCNCGGTCPANPNQIPTLNKIISIGNAAAASIQQAGVATLAAIAAQNVNPFLTIQVVPSSSENVVLSTE